MDDLDLIQRAMEGEEGKFGKELEKPVHTKLSTTIKATLPRNLIMLSSNLLFAITFINLGFHQWLKNFSKKQCCNKTTCYWS